MASKSVLLCALHAMSLQLYGADGSSFLEGAAGDAAAVVDELDDSSLLINGMRPSAMLTELADRQERTHEAIKSWKLMRKAKAAGSSRTKTKRYERNLPCSGREEPKNYQPYCFSGKTGFGNEQIHMKVLDIAFDMHGRALIHSTGRPEVKCEKMFAKPSLAHDFNIGEFAACVPQRLKPTLMRYCSNQNNYKMQFEVGEQRTAVLLAPSVCPPHFYEDSAPEENFESLLQKEMPKVPPLPKSDDEGFVSGKISEKVSFEY